MAMGKIEPLKSDKKDQLLFYIDKLNERLEVATNKLYAANSKVKKNDEKIAWMNWELARLDDENQKLKNELEELRGTANAPIVQKIKNERNAGRKPKVNDELIAKVRELRGEGKTQKLISECLNISVGTVNKIIRMDM